MNSQPTPRQLELLEKEDWRHFAIDAVGTGLGSIATSEKVANLFVEPVSFGLPSAPALFLALAHEARHQRLKVDLSETFIRRPPPQGIWPDDQKPLFDFFQFISAEVICAHTAIEAFVNECIPVEFEYEWSASGKSKQVLKGAEIERNVGLDEKLKAVLPSAHKISSPAGNKVWQNYKALKKTRDRLVHLKSLDRKSSGPDHQTIWGVLLCERRRNFVSDAYATIGLFPALVEKRRWYQQFGQLLARS